MEEKQLRIYTDLSEPCPPENSNDQHEISSEEVTMDKISAFVDDIAASTLG